MPSDSAASATPYAHFLQNFVLEASSGHTHSHGHHSIPVSVGCCLPTYKGILQIMLLPESYYLFWNKNTLILNIQRKFWESSIKCYINRHWGKVPGQSVICSYRTLNNSQLYRILNNSQLSDSCIMMNFTFHGTIGNWFNSLMTTMEILLKKLVCS